MPAPFLRVANWRRYQHYGSARKLRWVKLYIDMLNDPFDPFLELPYPAQLLFDRLLLLEAKAVNAGRRGFRNDSGWIAGEVRMDRGAVAKALPMLLKGGWLRESQTMRADSKPASSPVAKRYQSASPREQKAERASAKGSSEASFVSLPITKDSGKEFQIERLMGYIGAAADDGTVGTIRGFSRRLPEGSLAKVVESVRGKNGQVRDRAAYVVGALKKEIAECDRVSA